MVELTKTDVEVFFTENAKEEIDTKELTDLLFGTVYSTLTDRFNELLRDAYEEGFDDGYLQALQDKENMRNSETII